LENLSGLENLDNAVFPNKDLFCKHRLFFKPTVIKQKKPLSYEGGFLNILKLQYYNLATNLVNFDFKLEALLSWIIFFLANLSIIEITFDNLEVASDLSVAILNALIALRVVLCWYLFNTLFFSLLLILFRADL
jgi:hypothetical protein